MASDEKLSNLQGTATNLGHKFTVTIDMATVLKICSLKGAHFQKFAAVLCIAKSLSNKFSAMLTSSNLLPTPMYIKIVVFGT